MKTALNKKQIWKEMKKYIDNVNNGLMMYFDLEIDRRKDFVVYAVNKYIESNINEISSFMNQYKSELEEWIEEEIKYQEGYEEIEEEN